MGPIEQEALNLPDVLFREPPVPRPQNSEVNHRVRFDAAGVVHVALGVAERKCARRGEHGFSTVQTGVTRARHRSPTLRRAVDEDHMIEEVDRLETENERGKAMLLEDDRGRERGLEAVSLARADDTAKAPQRFPTLLSVVRERIQPALYSARRFETANETTLGCGERQRRRSRTVSAWERQPL